MGISRKTKRIVESRYGVRCYLCRRLTVVYGGEVSIRANTRTFDHVVPRSAGGDDSVENLRVCCLECNQGKADIAPAEVARGDWEAFDRRVRLRERLMELGFWGFV